MEIHHHHHHHHHMIEGGKFSFKSLGNDLKKTFTAHNAEQAGMAAIPAFTTAAGAALGGPLGAAGGAAAGYLADKGLQNAIHGDGLRKGTKKHIHYHRANKQKAKLAGDMKRHKYYSKKHAEAVQHYNENPYHYLSKDKDHQKNLRQARKTLKAMKEISHEADTTFAGDAPPMFDGSGFYRRGHKAYDDDGYKSKMMSHMKKTMPWVQHVKEFAKEHGLNYAQALKHPGVRSGYVSVAQKR